MAEGFEALSSEATSIPEAGIDDVMAELDKDETPRDETGKFTKREADGADDGDTAEESEPEAEAAEEDAAPEEASGEEDEDGEPEEAIDAPASWTDEAKEAFAQLPPDLKRVVSERESERERAVNARLAETAADRKAAQAEREAAQTERQNTAQFLAQVAAYARTMDPIIAQGSDPMYWQRLQQDDPDEYRERALEYQQRVQYLQAVEAEQQRLATESATQRKTAEETALKTKLPDFTDTARLSAFKDEALPILTEAGYSPQEIEQYWDHMPDHRQAVVLAELVRLRKQEATRKAIAEKKGKAQPPKVQKPKAQQDAKSQETARLAALRKQSERDPGNIDVLTELAQRSIGA